MFSANQYWITIAEVKGFSKVADSAFSSESREALTDYLAVNPCAGEIIPETDGVRMLRWPACIGGRRENVRVIFLFRDLNMPVYLLALYKKGERFSLSQREKLTIRQMVADIVATYASNRGSQGAHFGAA